MIAARDRTTVPVARLEGARERTLALVAGLDGPALDAQHDPLMSPLAWDLGHIAAYEDLWLAHRGAGLPLLRTDLAEVYDAFETPRAVRGDVAFLRHDEARAYGDEVRARTAAVADRLEPALVELVAQHEEQHGETMLQAMQLAGLPAPAWEPEPERAAGPAERRPLAGGRVVIGADGPAFAYDNERPAHAVEVAPFAIAARPVTQGELLAWVEDGGYGRRADWSPAGWAWREEQGIERPAAWTEDGGVRVFDRVTGLDPDRPAVHLSSFEADAVARGLGARLPTEAEWEHAARSGALAGNGVVWEWTATEFDGYPGFAAFPYREYSEVFFRSGHRVLRGGSWATAPAVARPTFRNWDLPVRRQLFAGLRLAWDA